MLEYRGRLDKVKIKIQVLCDVTPCRPFERSYCLCLPNQAAFDPEDKGTRNIAIKIHIYKS
jgi:hypothetical protein